jgi:hypothetical protein
MVLEERSHEEGVRTVPIFRIEGLVRTFFEAAVCVQGTVVPDFYSGMLESKELRWDVWHRVCEMYYSIVFIWELLHDIVRELTISNTWLAICVNIDLAQEARLFFDL